MLGRPSPRRRGGMNLELNDSVDSWFRPKGEEWPAHHEDGTGLQATEVVIS